MVLGCPGSGKSTLCRFLSTKYDLPLVSLDQHYFSPNWKETPEAAWHKKIQSLIRADHWVMDGNYGGTWDLRLRRSELVIYLDYPTYISFYRAMKRLFSNYGKVRKDMAPGCPERFDWPFIFYILAFNRTKRKQNLARLKENEANYKFLVFSHPKTLKSWIKSLD